MGKKPISLAHALRNVLAETLRDYIFLLRHRAVKELFYAPVYRYVQKISYYRGANQ